MKIRENNPSFKPSEPSQEEGSVLFLMTAFLSAISFIGATIFTLTHTDILIAGNYKFKTEAFNHADAGAEYVKSKINEDLALGTLILDSAVESVNYTAPSGYEFDPVTTLTRTADTNMYMFTVTGRTQGAQAVVEVMVRRDPILTFGVFADSQLDMKSSANIYSYDSGNTPSPTPADSTGKADLGSNASVISHNNTAIDGTLALGQDLLGTLANGTQQALQTFQAMLGFV